ncbi:MAG: hypothetical protein ACE5IR_07555 [bacterium]
MIFFIRQLIHVIFLCALLSCENPFTTREPESPEQRTSNFIPPSTPEIVFVNLQIAIKERNVENYIRSFVDTTRSSQSFSFIPDQGIAATNPGVFLNWQLEDERRYVTNLLQVTPRDSIPDLRFILEGSRSESSTSATFTQNYTLVVRHTRQESNIPTEFRGQSRFMLEKNETGDWAIYMWEDFANDDNPSWSELKAFFR